MMTKIRQRLNQKGFTLVELMVVIAILGILAAIAIPKFGDATATANTAKIQADLRTIDAAIVMYQAQRGSDPTGIGAAGDAATATTLMGAGLLVEPPTPPKGNCFIGKSTSDPVPDTTKYDLETVKGTLRAVCGKGTGNTSDTFKKS